MHGIQGNLAGLSECNLIVMFVESLKIMQFLLFGVCTGAISFDNATRAIWYISDSCASSQAMPLSSGNLENIRSHIHVLVAKPCPCVLKSRKSHPSPTQFLHVPRIMLGHLLVFTSA